MISANGPSAKLSKKVRRRQKAAMKRAAEKMAGEPAGGAQARSAEGKTDGVEEPVRLLQQLMVDYIGTYKGRTLCVSTTRIRHGISGLPRRCCIM